MNCKMGSKVSKIEARRVREEGFGLFQPMTKHPSKEVADFAVGTSGLNGAIVIERRAAILVRRRLELLIAYAEGLSAKHNAENNHAIEGGRRIFDALDWAIEIEEHESRECLSEEEWERAPQALTTSDFNGAIGAGRIFPPAKIELVLSSHADWDATSATLTGLDENGLPVSETLTIPNGGNATVTSSNHYSALRVDGASIEITEPSTAQSDGAMSDERA